MPDILYDGDYTVAQLVGPPEFEIPFPTDPKPYVYRLPYWQFLNSFSDLAFGTVGPLGGTYVGGTPGNFKSIGGGVIEFRREFALIPDTRNEYESFVYAFSFWQCSESCSIEELPLTLSSRKQYDYFQTDDPLSIDLPESPKAFMIFGNVYLVNGYGTIHIGDEILAENATMRHWKGNIFERTQRFIRAPEWWIEA